MNLWYLNEETAAKAAIKELGLTTKGNAGGWLRVYRDGAELWHGHGYHAAWPWLAEKFKEQLAPLPLVGQAYIKRYRCDRCGERRSVTPLQQLGPCSECGDEEWVHMCGACHWRPALIGRLVCPACADSPNLMKWWGPIEEALRERLQEPSTPSTQEGGSQ